MIINTSARNLFYVEASKLENWSNACGSPTKVFFMYECGDYAQFRLTGSRSFSTTEYHLERAGIEPRDLSNSASTRSNLSTIPHKC